MNKLLILDKDKTLVIPRSGGKWVESPKDQELMPGVADTLYLYAAAGWTLAIASNQGGVASGKKTLGSCIDEMFFAMRLTGIELAMAAHSYENEYGEAIFLDLTDGGIFWEPISNRNARFRKPSGGMIDYLASRIFDGGIPETLFVGDRAEDQGAAEAAGVRFMWAHDWVNGPGDIG